MKQEKGFGKSYQSARTFTQQPLAPKKYSEDDLILALEYQKAESYQVVGNLLISEEGKPDIEGALNYLCNDKIISIETVDEMLNDMKTNG